MQPPTPITLLPSAPDRSLVGTGRTQHKMGAAIAVADGLKLSARWKTMNSTGLTLDGDSSGYIGNDVVVVEVTFKGRGKQPVVLTTDALRAALRGTNGTLRLVAPSGMSLGTNSKVFGTRNNAASGTPGNKAMEASFLFNLAKDDKMEALIVAGSCSACPAAGIVIR